MSEEIRTLKEILNNNDLDNYTIDDDECYLNGYARKCLKKVLEENKLLHSIIKEVREYIEEHSEMTNLQINGIENILAFRGNCRELLEILGKVEEKE